MFIVEWGCEDPKHVYEVDRADKKLRIDNNVTRFLFKTDSEDHGEGEKSWPNHHPILVEGGIFTLLWPFPTGSFLEHLIFLELLEGLVLLFIDLLINVRL